MISVTLFELELAVKYFLTGPVMKYGIDSSKFRSVLTVKKPKINTHFCICTCLHANVCMYAYTYIWVYTFRIKNSPCVLLSEVRFRHGVSWNCNTPHPSKVVSLSWPQQTEDGCHQSMWNMMFEPFRSYCDMTRFRAYQTLIHIMWTLCFTPIYLFSEFRKCINSISIHCAINDWMNYVKIFRRLNQLYSDRLKKTMQYGNVQCNIAELCMYVLLKLQLSSVFISRREAVCMLDSDTITKPWVWCMSFEHRLQIK